jgi:hypothetical protein
MAIDTYFNVTIDPNSPNVNDIASMNPVVARGTANANHITVAFDKAKVARKGVLKSALLAVIKAVDGGSELT